MKPLFSSNKFWVKTISKLNRKRAKNRKQKNLFYTNDEKNELFLKYKNEGCLKSRDELLASTYAFVLQQIHLYVNRHGNFGFDIEDFEQEGNLALLDALDRYDPSKGTFPSFVRVYLPKYFFPFIKNNGSTIRLSDGAIQNIKQEIYSCDEFIRQYNRYPMSGETVEYVWNEKTVQHTFGENYNMEILSANSPVSNSREQEVTEEIIDSLTDEPEYFNDDIKNYVVDLLNKKWIINGKEIKITDREREIIEKKYYVGMDIKDMVYDIMPQENEIKKCKERGFNQIEINRDGDTKTIELYCLPENVLKNTTLMDYNIPKETKYEDLQLSFKKDDNILYLKCNGKEIRPTSNKNNIIFNIKLKKGYCVTSRNLYETQRTAFNKLRKIINHTKNEYLY